MYEFRCTEEGLYYYDPILRREMFASNTLLFLIGYSRIFGDTKVSDKLFLPNVLLDYKGDLVHLTNISFLNQARTYLSELGKVESLDSGDVFDLYGLPMVLESLGFYNFYSSSSSYQSSLDRVPHVPLFTKRSQDYIRINDILKRKKYWNTPENRQINIGIPFSKKDISFISPKDTVGKYPLYAVYNTEFKDDQAESLDLYNSFGSFNYMESCYSGVDLNVLDYDDYCSYFIWNSLSLTTLYQFSLGVLYGLFVMGWGYLPFSVRPTEYYAYYKYIKYADEAFFWFQNTPLDKTGKNKILNINADLFRIDTHPNIEYYKVLSPSVMDTTLWYNLDTGLCSIDKGNTWVTKDEFNIWLLEHDEALPVTSDTGEIGLWLGDQHFIVPLSDWE